MTSPFPPLEDPKPFVLGDDPRRSIIARGYAFMPQLLDPGVVRDLREAILRCAAEAGYLAPGTEPVDAVPGSKPADERERDAYLPFMRAVQELEGFHALGHDPAIVSVVESVVGEEVVPYPSKIVRLRSPSPEVKPSNPHQDYYFTQGSTDAIVAWVPLGDARGDEGALAVMAGSHRLGLWGADWLETDDPSLEWHGGDFRAGDVLLFHVLTMHGGGPNAGDRVRVSVDYRYQPVGDPMASGWLQPHYEVGEWDELYRGWSRTDLQWYWRDLPLEVVEHEPDIRKLRGRCHSRLFEVAQPV